MEWTCASLMLLDGVLYDVSSDGRVLTPSSKPLPPQLDDLAGENAAYWPRYSEDELAFALPLGAEESRVARALIRKAQHA